MNRTTANVIADGIVIQSADEVLWRDRIATELLDAWMNGASFGAQTAINVQKHHNERCSDDCKCADGYHIAMTIRTLAIEEAKS